MLQNSICWEYFECLVSDTWKENLLMLNFCTSKIYVNNKRTEQWRKEWEVFIVNIKCTLLIMAQHHSRTFHLRLVEGADVLYRRTISERTIRWAPYYLAMFLCKTGTWNFMERGRICLCTYWVHWNPLNVLFQYSTVQCAIRWNPIKMFLNNIFVSA